MSKYALILTAVVFAAPIGAAAQDSRAQVDEIRRQIQLLQSKLDTIDQSRKPNSRVTQIGANRGRLRNTPLAVRIYDLGDLFAIAPAYHARQGGELSGESRPVFEFPLGERTGGLGGGFGGGGIGGGFFSMKRDATTRRKPREVLKQLQPGQEKPISDARVSLDSLVNVITQVISPEVWQDAGGTATIGKLGNALIISADTQTHEQIDQLLNLFRKRWGTLRTISVRAYWLWLGDTELKTLLAEPGKAGDVRAFGLVDEAQFIKALQNTEKAGNDSPRGYRAAVTCYNGQTVHTLAGGQSLAVTQVRPILLRGETDTPRDRVAYRPELTAIHDGAALQVTPIANVAGKTVVLDIHSRIANVSDQPAAKVAANRGAKKSVTPQELVAVLDRKRIALQRLSTTLRVPVDRTMLVGGMSFAAGEQKSRQTLYLFVKVSVQELRNDQEKPQPKRKKPVQAKRAKR